MESERILIGGRPTTLAGRKARTDAERAWVAARAAARAAGLTRYEGRPCKKCGTTTRWSCRARCVVCHAESQKVYRKKARGGLTNEQRFARGYPVPTRPAPQHCEICGNADKRALSLDHCHDTGRFRGWLCGKCNASLGRFGDTISGVEQWFNSAMAYLRRSQSN